MIMHKNSRKFFLHDSLFYYVNNPSKIQGTVMQIEKAQINDRLRVSKVS